ncbi:MAG: tetratricopeptide repeat protein [Bryobacteraceae bacterium]
MMPALVSVLLAVSLAAQAISPDVMAHVAAGLAAQKAGRYDEAIAAFTKVADLAPNLAAAHVNLGKAYMDNGDYPSAIAPLRRSIELNPNLPGARQMLGHSLLASGYAAGAISFLETTDAAALGIALFKAGRSIEAIVQLNAALVQRPNDPDILYYLGRAGGSVSKQSFDALQATHPHAARTHQLLGELNAVQRKLPEAEKEYREALRIRPDTPDVHLQLAELYATAGDWEKAVFELRLETRARPGDPEAAFRLGNALLELGNVADARHQLERAMALDPAMPETLYALGKACWLGNDLGAAEKHWLALLAIEKESSLAAQTYFALAGLYRKNGSAAQAGTAMREFQRLQPKAAKP